MGTTDRSIRRYRAELLDIEVMWWVPERPARAKVEGSAWELLADETVLLDKTVRTKRSERTKRSA